MNYEAAHTVPTVEVWGCLFLTYIHKFRVLARDNEIDVNCPILITSLAGSGELQMVWLAGIPTPQYFAVLQMVHMNYSPKSGVFSSKIKQAMSLRFYEKSDSFN